MDWMKGVSRVSLIIDDRSGWDHTTVGAMIEVTRRGLQDAQWTIDNVRRGPALLDPAVSYQSEPSPAPQANTPSQ
jgi:hypothetical protein